MTTTSESSAAVLVVPLSEEKYREWCAIGMEGAALLAAKDQIAADTEAALGELERIRSRAREEDAAADARHHTRARQEGAQEQTFATKERRNAELDAAYEKHVGLYAQVVAKLTGAAVSQIRALVDEGNFGGVDALVRASMARAAA